MLTIESNSLLKANLEKDPSVAYVLDRDLRICYCNEAWDRFAAENGGRGLERQYQVGRSVMDVIPEPLKRFFREGYDRVLASRQPWEHCYECSSPALYRSFRMVVYPNPEAEGFVVVNSLTIERPHQSANAPHYGNDFVYLDELGFVTMCCQCRRSSRSTQPHIWDWVPTYVTQPPDAITHGICSTCLNLIYPNIVK